MQFVEDDGGRAGRRLQRPRWRLCSSFRGHRVRLALS